MTIQDAARQAVEEMNKGDELAASNTLVKTLTDVAHAINPFETKVIETLSNELVRKPLHTIAGTPPEEIRMNCAPKNWSQRVEGTKTGRVIE